jgi:hypothetical protein
METFRGHSVGPLLFPFFSLSKTAGGHDKADASRRTYPAVHRGIDVVGPSDRPSSSTTGNPAQTSQISWYTAGQKTAPTALSHPSSSSPDEATYGRINRSYQTEPLLPTISRFHLKADREWQNTNVRMVYSCGCGKRGQQIAEIPINNTYPRANI